MLYPASGILPNPLSSPPNVDIISNPDRYVATPPLARNTHFSAPNLDIQPEHNLTWITHNQNATRALFLCIERRDCAQNQTKVVLIPSFDYIIPLQGGYIGGEAIWALSTFQALRNMGYTVLFAANMEGAVHLYHIFGNLVKIVIASVDQASKCFRSTTCVRSAANPPGIPAWKIFSQHFWQNPANPLGAKWTLSPEPYRGGTTYLGYSIEGQCAKYPFIPHGQRKAQVYILAKFLKFFHPDSRTWKPEFFDAATNATGLSFVMAARDLPGAPKISPSDLPASLENLIDPSGRSGLKQAEFYDVLSRSVALVGVGNPMLSPTPYDALCLGVPFVNPVKRWDPKNPDDRTKWQTQHDQLRHLSAPYVYNVRVGDRDGFVNAIKDAAANPIQSHVLERMKMSSVEHRLGNIIEHDWKAEAAELLRAREGGSVQGATFLL
ncbi:hypothetical protein MVEN_00964400 [Mycena venus]|uniref:Uncharacterized protein n=1 Tax=Mycena venus TaxID=2733690 RepID=A0A8H7D261_9AGAR|nr:hypothetical protein MVEN_00964400 [Mycena venus]